MPYQATAIDPRKMAGMLAPRTPKGARQTTGNGTPATWLGFATRLTKYCTMTMPIINEIRTCQLVRPRANKLPAVR